MPNYPYISGQAGLVGAFTQLRKGFPSQVDSGYLQRFNIARANESYVISILRFLGLIDEEGNRVEENTDYFFGNDETFQAGLEGTMRSAYSQLFDEMGDKALKTDRGDLTHWFRASDKTTELVGSRQASTFQTLAALAGHGEVPVARANGSKKAAAAPKAKSKTSKAAASKQAASEETGSSSVAVTTGQSEAATSGPTLQVQNGQDVGLTVRVEVNLPAGGDADTYDAIFASIKKHLMS